jgi:hypothetical protein
VEQNLLEEMIIAEVVKKWTQYNQGALKNLENWMLS